MEKTFTLRVDVESDKGIREGLPQLLNLFKKYNIKASFYLTMGGESNIFELLRYRGKLKSAGERKIRIFSFWEKLRMIFFPKDFVASNIDILSKILKEGHELGIHGWKHRAWTRGLDKINIEEHVKKAIERYREIFKRSPISFCAPGFNTNKKVLEILKKNKIKFISDFNDEKIKVYSGLKNVPITIKGENNTPIIEYLASSDYDDEKILKYFAKEIKKHSIVSFYIHDLYEARFKIKLLEKIFKLLNKIKNKRIIDY